MPSIPAHLLDRAFIDPIRFALLVDDKFPTYKGLLDKVDEGDADGIDRARKLYEVCKAKDWLCDVENAAGPVEVFEQKKHLNQSDLLILDWHLNPNDDTDTTGALRILQQLASGDHFNLVVIYTSAYTSDVCTQLAYCLGAGMSLDEEQDQSAREHIEELDDPLELNTDVLVEFLRGLPDTGFNALKNQLKGSVDDETAQEAMIISEARRRFESTTAPEIIQQRRADLPVTWYDGNEGIRLVHQNNLFAAIVSKEIEPDQVIEELSKALLKWSPSPLQVMLVHARSQLEKRGLGLDSNILRKPIAQAGWLLAALESDKTADGIALKSIYERLFDQLMRELLTDVSSFGSELIQSDGSPAYDKACAWARTPPGVRKELIYQAANAFLCTSESDDGHVTVGVVFKEVNGDQLWVCLTPACDLVPGQNNKNGWWEGDIYPCRAITAARLKKLTGSKEGDALKNAHRGLHVFLDLGDSMGVYEVLDPSSKKLNLQVVLVVGEARIENRKFEGRIIHLDATQSPTFREGTFEVVTRLRGDYASKFLSEAGQQKSRIGLDWLSMP